MTLELALIIITFITVSICQAFTLYFVVKVSYQVAELKAITIPHQVSLVKQQNEICALLNTANKFLEKIASRPSNSSYKSSNNKEKDNFKKQFS